MPNEHKWIEKEEHYNLRERVRLVEAQMSNVLKELHGLNKKLGRLVWIGFAALTGLVIDLIARFSEGFPS